MKKLFALQFIVIVLFGQLQAQYDLEWSPQNSGTENTLRSVFFVDSLQGYAAGSNGEIIHTPNGGNSWDRQTSGVTNNLNSVFFVSNSLGWAVGGTSTAGPVILKTDNGGLEWLPQPTDSITNNILTAGHFTSDMMGWVCGSNYIYITIDGGETWTSEKIADNNAYDILDLEFTDDGSGRACGRIIDTNEGLILHRFVYTDDTVWHKVKSYPESFFQKISFLDDSTGWAASGSNIARKIINDPDTWSLEHTGAQSSNFVFTDESNGLIFGEDGIVFTSSDGGINWEMKDTVSTGFTTMYDIFAVDRYNIWTVGPQGSIFKANKVAPSGIGNLIRQNNFILYPVQKGFNGNLTLNLSIMNHSSMVNLDVYNINGQIVMQLESNMLVPGEYQYEISSAIQRGVYIISLMVDGRMASQKFIK